MHYKNGRPAKDGDRIVNLTTGLSGLLYGSQPQSQSCNGRLAECRSSDAYITIGECLAIEDVAKATVPDSTASCDGVKKYDIAGIESERRNGYAWYGAWGEQVVVTTHRHREAPRGAGGHDKPLH
jgi:hypothetical protein